MLQSTGAKHIASTHNDVMLHNFKNSGISNLTGKVFSNFWQDLEADFDNFENWQGLNVSDEFDISLSSDYACNSIVAAEELIQSIDVGLAAYRRLDANQVGTSSKVLVNIMTYLNSVNSWHRFAVSKMVRAHEVLQVLHFLRWHVDSQIKKWKFTYSRVHIQV